MLEQTRRDFLRRAALAAGAVAAGPMAGKAVAQAASPADMCIARWRGEAGAYTDETRTLATRLTEQAIGRLGGMGRFVQRGDVVWVKPNMAWNRTPEQAATTNPDVVATLVRLCLEAGAKKVKVGDNTCNPARQTYPNSGIEAAAKEAGAEVLYIDNKRFREMSVNGQRLRTWELYPEIIESDLVINVPVVKHHAIATMTVCMKNYMGVAGGPRGQWHQDMPTCLADITAFMKPRLCVVDAIRVLTANGPSGGSLGDVKRLDTVAAGTDIVALDAFGAELLGHEQGAIATVNVAHAAGLGQMDYRKLALKEIEVS